MVHRRGITIMLAQLEAPAGPRPNRRVDPEGGAWDAYIWVDDADALHAEFAAKGVTIARGLCNQVYDCRDFFEIDETATGTGSCSSYCR